MYKTGVVENMYKIHMITKSCRSIFLELTEYGWIQKDDDDDV